MPTWIMEELMSKRSSIAGFSGKQPLYWFGPKVRLKAKCVCKDCNEGWMSKLEFESKPIIGPLMRDISLHINKQEQMTIAKWAAKTAMTLESISRSHRKPFYRRDECTNLKESFSVPPRTLVWLGRYTGIHEIGFFGVDSWDEKPEHPEVTHLYASTILVGRLVIQISTVHAADKHRNRPVTINPNFGPWNDLLIMVDPSGGTISWPPIAGFSDEGSSPLEGLVQRWKGGTPISPLRFA